MMEHYNIIYNYHPILFSLEHQVRWLLTPQEVPLSRCDTSWMLRFPSITTEQLESQILRPKLDSF
jgi:hypothetical protein